MHVFNESQLENKRATCLTVLIGNQTAAVCHVHWCWLLEKWHI